MRTLMELWNSIWERPHRPSPEPYNAALAGEMAAAAEHLMRTTRLMQRSISLARQVDGTQGEIESLKLRVERLEIRLQKLEDTFESERWTGELAPVREMPPGNRRAVGPGGRRRRWDPRPGEAR